MAKKNIDYSIDRYGLIYIILHLHSIASTSPARVFFICQKYREIKKVLKVCNNESDKWVPNDSSKERYWNRAPA